MITLPPETVAGIIEDARESLVGQLLTEHRDALQLLSPAQVCGVLDVMPATLARMKKLPRVTLAPSVIRYRAADVAAYIQSRRA